MTHKYDFNQWLSENVVVSRRELMAPITVNLVESAWVYQQKEIDRLTHIVKSLVPERFPGPFICGVGGPVDNIGLPRLIHVCPSYGVEGFAVYEKKTEYTAPGW